MNKKDTYGVIILIILYIYQGLILGLPGGAVQIILAALGFNYNDIGLFQLCSLPFIFKFLWSPILDYYFIERFGKRKSYIIPLTALLVVLLLTLASKVELFIIEKDVGSLFKYFFVAIFLLATMDSAIDGWALTLVSPDNVGVCSACQNFGQQLGWFFSQHIFIILNSVEFSNKYLNIVYSDIPFLTLSGYLSILAAFGVGIIIWLIIATREVNPEISYEYTSFCEEVNLIRGLYYNKYLRTLCIILFIKRIGLGTMETVGPVYLVKNGFPKETLSQISIAAFPFVVSIPFCVGRFATGRRRENRTLMVTIGYAIVNMVIFTFSVHMFTDGDKNKAVAMIAMNLFAQEAIKRVFYTVSFAFILEVSEAQVGAIQISALGSISNFSRVFLDPFFIIMLHYVPYHVMLVGGILQQIFVIKKYGRRYIQMQYLPKEVWNLKNDHYIELQQ